MKHTYTKKEALRIVIATAKEYAKMLEGFLKKIGLPTTFKDLGLENVTDEELMRVAEASCAEGETTENLPFAVTPADVVAALKMADIVGRSLT